jgi:hypothetical protein
MRHGDVLFATFLRGVRHGDVLFATFLEGVAWGRFVCHIFGMLKTLRLAPGDNFHTV